MSGEPTEGEPEAALGSPKVGRMLHAIDTDLVQLERLGPSIGNEWRIAIGGVRLLTSSYPSRLLYNHVLDLGLNVSDL